MKRSSLGLRLAVGFLAFCLLALLLYSIDRTAWLFGLYEQSVPGSPAGILGLSPHALAVQAALVVELSAVAFVVSEGVAHQSQIVRRWVNAGLIAVLIVQTLANLLAGFIRGFWTPATLLQMTHDSSIASRAAMVVVITTWLAANTIIPFGIYFLSKILAHLLPIALRATRRPFFIRGAFHRALRAREALKRHADAVEKEAAALRDNLTRLSMEVQSVEDVRTQLQAAQDRIRALEASVAPAAAVTAYAATSKAERAAARGATARSFGFQTPSLKDRIREIMEREQRDVSNDDLARFLSMPKDRFRVQATRVRRDLGYVDEK